MTVVVGFVPTSEGRAALRRAIEEAKAVSSTLIVLDSTGNASATDELDQLLAGPAAEGIQIDRRSVMHPKEPAEDIINVAEAESADLIVIGLRRRTPVGKLILGSNAQRILLDAHCPVLAVKGEPGA
ncbi:universal stress protein [Dermacoccaceae bacterium W4C1]